MTGAGSAPGTVSSSTLSPRSVPPFQGPLPVSIRMRPPPGSTTAPPRERIAESLAGSCSGGCSAVAVCAERVEHGLEPAAGSADRDDVALVGRYVAEVAAGRRQQVRPVDVQRRAELLVLGFERHPHRPGAFTVFAAVGQRELVDQPVGRGGVHVAAVGICQRARDRDLGRASPAPIAGRRERPQARDRCSRRSRTSCRTSSWRRSSRARHRGRARCADRSARSPTVPGRLRCRRCSRPTFALVMPVASSLASPRCGSRPNSGHCSSCDAVLAPPACGSRRLRRWSAPGGRPSGPSSRLPCSNRHRPRSARMLPRAAQNRSLSPRRPDRCARPVCTHS